MNRNILPALFLLAALPALVACGNTDSSNAATGIAAEIDPELQRDMREAAREVREAMAGRNIELAGQGEATHAEITPAGELLVDGRPVATDARQRQLLLAYREHIIGMAETGAAFGQVGVRSSAGMIGDAVTTLLTTGDTEKMQERMQADAMAIAEQARDTLCARMPAMLETQQQLAAAVPGFRPFADMTQADIDECRIQVAMR